MNLAYKILSSKLKSGELVAGQQIRSEERRVGKEC